MTKAQATIGILMLDTNFPRFHGDIANANTWPFPVKYHVVKGATANKAVCQDPTVLLDDFIIAAQDLVASGCAGITTSCGFLTLLQDQISANITVPFASSALMQIPIVQQMLPPGKRVGVITISRNSLTAAHLIAANAPIDTPVVGTDNGRCLTHSILNDLQTMKFSDCRQDLLDAAQELITKHKDIGAIVLECTNMPPYAADIRNLTGLPVFSIYSYLRWFHQSLSPDPFG